MGWDGMAWDGMGWHGMAWLGWDRLEIGEGFEVLRFRGFETFRL